MSDITVADALKNNNNDFSVAITYDNKTLTILNSDYVKQHIKLYTGGNVWGVETQSEFNSLWATLKNEWLNSYSKLFITLLDKLYNLSGSTTETWTGTKTHTRTDNLKNATNTNFSNTVTNNLKNATNTDMDATVTGSNSNTHKVSGMDGGLSDDNTDSGSNSSTTNTTGSKSNNYTETTGTVTTAQEGTKANNYTESTGTVTDVESFDDYVRTMTNTETDYMMYGKFIEECDRIMVNKWKLLDDLDNYFYLF